MSIDTVYRFFVREKIRAGEGASTTSGRIFLTRTFLSEAEAAQRYEVVERLDHTARQRERVEAEELAGAC